MVARSAGVRHPTGTALKPQTIGHLLLLGPVRDVWVPGWFTGEGPASRLKFAAATPHHRQLRIDYLVGIGDGRSAAVGRPDRWHFDGPEAPIAEDVYPDSGVGDRRPSAREGHRRGTLHPDGNLLAELVWKASRALGHACAFCCVAGHTGCDSHGGRLRVAGAPNVGQTLLHRANSDDDGGYHGHSQKDPPHEKKCTAATPRMQVLNDRSGLASGSSVPRRSAATQEGTPDSALLDAGPGDRYHSPGRDQRREPA